MRHPRDEERIVYQSLAMITQFGLNMIVPVCIMSGLGIWLDRKFGTSFWTILLFAVGAVAGGQNIYRIAKKMCGGEDALKNAPNGKKGTAGSGKENRDEQGSGKSEES